jgi:hypothetical protein
MSANNSKVYTFDMSSPFEGSPVSSDRLGGSVTIVMRSRNGTYVHVLASTPPLLLPCALCPSLQDCARHSHLAPGRASAALSHTLYEGCCGFNVFKLLALEPVSIQLLAGGDLNFVPGTCTSAGTLLTAEQHFWFAYACRNV